ncbi:MAG: phosphoheptose isomerase family protein, partial [Candidatus Latescibacterota bacterium]
SMWDTGHSTQNDQYPDRNGEPVIIDPGWNANAAQKGDLLLASRWGGPYEVVAEKDIFVIGGPAPWGGDAIGQEKLTENVQKSKIRPHAKIWIETNITTMGPEVYIPGEPAPFGAISGILGMVQYWMMLADACRILSREGYKGQVEGDEPKLTEKAPWVNTGQPLMGGYFQTVMDQIEMVKGEMGDIRRAASAIVDVVLSGGSVYYYSRAYAGPATEALGRRGGLALNKADWEGNKEFKGTRKDIAIMHLNKPNCAIDLKHLDVYRKAGMKVFSLGPEARDGRIPDGRTVPKETDMHFCRIADTYGLFAVPGFDQKVCPTSGPVMNQAYWALQMEIAEEIIRRTGNVPGINMSAAIKGGNEHNAIVRRRLAVRGY